MLIAREPVAVRITAVGGRVVAREPLVGVVKQGGRSILRLGETDVDYDENFRFYMTSKLPNPHYMPELCIKVTLINFTVTMSGLEDQLLGAVVGKERPDLERAKSKLVVSMAKDAKQLKELEDKNRRLKKMYAEERLVSEIRKEVIEGKW